VLHAERIVLGGHDEEPAPRRDPRAMRPDENALDLRRAALAAAEIDAAARLSPRLLQLLVPLRELRVERRRELAVVEAAEIYRRPCELRRPRRAGEADVRLDVVPKATSCEVR